MDNTQAVFVSKKCLSCNKDFVARQHIKSCSPQCRAALPPKEKKPHHKTKPGLDLRDCFACGLSFTPSSVRNKYCKPCGQRLSHKGINDKEINRNAFLRKKYGISIQEVDRMILEQEGKCKICKIDFVGQGAKISAPCVDHCHSTGKVRGILCNSCNKKLGPIEDQVFLHKATAYLKSFL